MNEQELLEFETSQSVMETYEELNMKKDLNYYWHRKVVVEYEQKRTWLEEDKIKVSDN